MGDDPRTVVSPSDARVLTGSLAEQPNLRIKEKFFDLDGLLGEDPRRWHHVFRGGDFAVFRLTPDKYHYNHTPVAGLVLDVFERPGDYHSCNPGAVLRLATPLSTNTRAITVFETDVPGGTGVGRVAMIEVAAMMIGDVCQRYSRVRYETPRPLAPGMVVDKGCPKSLFRPGSSTVVLLFEPDRIRFAPDLLANQDRPDVMSRYSVGFGRPIVETEIRARSDLGKAVRRHPFFRREYR
jgi:phosphatidylserine decarboxylase